MGILNVCKVVAEMKELKKDGTSGAAVQVPYYFLGSTVYAETTFATCTGIELIPSDKWDGSHPVVPVAELIQAGILNRLNVQTLDSAKKKRRYEVVVAQAKVGKIFDGTAAEKLDGKAYKLKKRDGSVIDRGTVIRIGGDTTNYNP